MSVLPRLAAGGLPPSWKVALQDSAAMQTKLVL